MRLFILVSICLLLNCAGTTVATPDVPQEGTAYLKAIKTREHVNLLVAPPVDEAFSGMVEIKVVFEIKLAELYFVNGHQYVFHEDFCTAELGYWQGNYQFNKNQYYENKRRRYLLGKLLYFKAQRKWLLEFIPSDMINARQVLTMLTQVREHTFFGDEISVLVHRDELYEKLKEKDVPLISESEVYEGMQYQALNKGKAFGYLRWVPVNEVSNATLGPKDILVTDGTPNDIPPLAGMLTSRFQTPLSHISILCRNRKTPLAAFRDLKGLKLDGLYGQPVKFVVKIDTLVIEGCSVEDVEKYWEEVRSRKGVELSLDTSVQGLVSLKEMKASEYASIGAKAANFGSLQKAIEFDSAPAKTPEGAVAIPISHYFNHLHKNHLGSLIRSGLQEIQGGSEKGPILDSIRTAIKEAPIDDELLRLVQEHLQAYPQYRKWRFRSSTNAEDLKGFNGAGLYTSKSAHLDDEKKTIERAIKRVWAGCWNDRAFLEREYYQLDHEKVGMGILVHRSFPNEEANGVVISTNVYDRNNSGIVINVQMGETSVVAPDSGVVCEQLIYSTSDYLSARPVTVQYLSKSSITGGSPVLSDDDLAQIAEAVEKVKQYFFENVDRVWSKEVSSFDTGFRRFTEIKEYYDFGLDIEFKIDGYNRALYLKQVRPYR